jgi:hypothetical protein
VTILRVGPNKQYSDGWEQAFSGKKAGAKSAAKPAAKKPTPSKKASPKKAKKGKK